MRFSNRIYFVPVLTKSAGFVRLPLDWFLCGNVQQKIAAHVFNIQSAIVAVYTHAFYPNRNEY
jgi:hypothetical protein